MRSLRRAIQWGPVQPRAALTWIHHIVIVIVAGGLLITWSDTVEARNLPAAFVLEEEVRLDNGGTPQFRLHITYEYDRVARLANVAEPILEVSLAMAGGPGTTVPPERFR